MTEQELIAKASDIPAISARAARSFSEALEPLAAGVTARMLASGNVEMLVGFGNLHTMADTHRRQARFLAALFAEFDPKLMIRTISRAVAAHRPFGFQDLFWVVQLGAWKAVLADELDRESADEIRPYFEWLDVHLPHIINLGAR